MTEKINTQKYYAIIPAAGVGMRMQHTVAKQYLPLKNKTILEHAIEPFLQHPKVEKIVVCLSANDKEWSKLELANHSKINTTHGGRVRAESVLNGLLTLKEQADAQDWVIVHDAVRPCLKFEELHKFIEAISDVGGLMALPIKDTLKFNNENVITTINRDMLWSAQTPQMFRYGKLITALQQADLTIITDESQAIELLGEKPMLVRGRHDNIKVTFPDDLELAEKILSE